MNVDEEEKRESDKASHRVEMLARDHAWPSVSRHIDYQLGRRASISDVVRAAGHDPHDPHTQMPKLSALAQQMIDMPKWDFTTGAPQKGSK